MRKLVTFSLLFITFLAVGASYTLENIPNPKVRDSRTYVSNPDGIISENTVNEINVLLDSLEKSTRTEVAVVIVESIGNEYIESFATSLFKSWGVGKAKEDNGLLILFVADQRKVRLEVGYGLEGVLPDAVCGRIRDESMIPYFKQGDYDTGFLKGIQHVVSVVKHENFVEKKEPVAWGEILPVAGAAYVLIFVITLLWVMNAAAKARKNPVFKSNIARYKAFKTENAAILLIMNIAVPVVGIFIIMMFSNPFYLVFLIGIPLSTVPANIYSRLVMRQIRRTPIPCNSCEGTMHILSERKEDAYLKVSQQFEEQLHAVDYDVFVCKDCGNEAVFTLDKPSLYSECPKCKTKAFILHDRRVMVAPTYISSGTERTTYKCKFCGYEEHNNTNIPRYTRNAGAFAAGTIAGSVFSGRGGFGGGGGGFSGGSFGGGMSGGGGATGSW